MGALGSMGSYMCSQASLGLDELDWQIGLCQGAPQHHLNHFSKVLEKCINFWSISSYFGALMGASGVKDVQHCLF